MNEELHDLLFGIRRSIRYHNRRVMFYDRLRMTIQFVTTMAGTATVAVVLGTSSAIWQTIVALLVAFFATLDQVINTSAKARRHEDLARRFCALERDIVLQGDAAVQHLTMHQAARLSIEADEPPVLRILDVICHNELCRATGCEPSHMRHLTWLQTKLAPFIDFGNIPE